MTTDTAPTAPDVTQAVKAALEAAAEAAYDACAKERGTTLAGLVASSVSAIDPATIIAALAEGRG